MCPQTFFTRYPWPACRWRRLFQTRGPQIESTVPFCVFFCRMRYNISPSRRIQRGGMVKPTGRVLYYYGWYVSLRYWNSAVFALFCCKHAVYDECAAAAAAVVRPRRNPSPKKEHTNKKSVSCMYAYHTNVGWDEEKIAVASFRPLRLLKHVPQPM